MAAAKPEIQVRISLNPHPVPMLGVVHHEPPPEHWDNRSVTIPNSHYCYRPLGGKL